MLSDRKIRLLKILTRGSKRLLDLTGTSVADSCSPFVIENHLTSLCEAGYVALHEDRYSITPAGEAALAEHEAMARVPGWLFCNASTTEPYKAPKWNTRADGQPRIESRGWA